MHKKLIKNFILALITLFCLTTFGFSVSSYSAEIPNQAQNGEVKGADVGQEVSKQNPLKNKELSSVKVMLVGDSITKFDSYAPRRLNFEKVAENGQTAGFFLSTTILELNFLSRFEETEPNVVVIHLGTNDALHLVSLNWDDWNQNVRNSLEGYLKILKDKNTYSILSNVYIDRGDSFAAYEKILSLNEIISDLARTYDVDVFDYLECVKDYVVLTGKPALGDGLHPTADFDEYRGDKLREMIESKL